MHDTDARRSVMFGKADVDSLVGEETIEFVMMLSFDEGGEKITRIDEFFDSATYGAFFAKVQEMQQAGAEAEPLKA